MNQDEFNKFLEKSNKVIAIDFDGVIHNDYLGYNDGTIYGEPIEGSIQSIKRLSENYTLKIYSCKSNPNRPLINQKTGTELIWEWLEKHGIKENISDVVWGKPNAVIYIDDKGYRFENWNDTYTQLNKLL
jgi:histidinol phosphatase-like enzyme|tara:strand:- start:583 stop:972 length:390 start_codon:yes stop_codon:yes gene_type:complete